MSSAYGKKIKDPEFIGWKAMHEQQGRPGCWVWMNPENTMVALVDALGNVLFVSTKDAKVCLYEHPDIKRLAHNIMQIPHKIV
jgi:hypothetical protein